MFHEPITNVWVEILWTDLHQDTLIDEGLYNTWSRELSWPIQTLEFIDWMLQSLTLIPFHMDG